MQNLNLDDIPVQITDSSTRGAYRCSDCRDGERHSDSADGPAGVEGNQIMERVIKELKTHLRKKFTCIIEGTSANQSQFKNVYTNLYITQQTEGYGRKQHEILDTWILSKKSLYLASTCEQINCLDIFKPGRNIRQLTPEKGICIQRVMTKGIAGIGKTVAVQNFSLDWAEGKSNQHIDLIFVIPCRELNLLRASECSLMELLYHFYPELKLLEDAQQLVQKCVLFIFDGLDECRFPLDFEGAMTVTDIVQPTTVTVLLTNIIRGNLLPNALLWVTSRPAAASQIPSQYIDQMTEVQGFTDRQRVEYFRKKFSHSKQAKAEVLVLLRGMASFYFMGHIPIFCWILAEVFKEWWSVKKTQRITTMTELYIYYLLIQIQRTTRKYGTQMSKKAQKEKSETRNAEMLLKLSKLAFEQFQQGNIIFYEEDLVECGIDVDQASVFCGFCSEILKQEHGLYQKRMFSFVHLSFQEFLAALYMFHSCVTRNSSTLQSFLGVDQADLGQFELQRRVVDKALQCENGELDLFLCFFLGFSLESNQKMLPGLLPQMTSSTETVVEMKNYLRNFHAGTFPPERCLNLLLCKLELKEERFQDDIRMYLQSGVQLLPIDCSILAAVLQISQELVEELDLSICRAPSGGIEKLFPILKKCKRAM